MSERAIDCKLEAWERQDGEKQMGLYWTPRDMPEIKVLLLAWFSYKDGWQTSAMIQVIEELYAGLMSGKYEKKNYDWDRV